MKLSTELVEDQIVRENLKNVEDEFNKLSFQPGFWRFFEITITQTGSVTHQYPHGFSFVPKDVIQTSLTGTGALTWNYGSFTRENLSFTTTGPCVVRALIGTYSRR